MTTHSRVLGLNVVAALQLAGEVGKGGMVVTAACGSGFKHLDGALHRDDTRQTNPSDT